MTKGQSLSHLPNNFGAFENLEKTSEELRLSNTTVSLKPAFFSHPNRNFHLPANSQSIVDKSMDFIQCPWYQILALALTPSHVILEKELSLSLSCQGTLLKVSKINTHMIRAICFTYLLYQILPYFKVLTFESILESLMDCKIVE